MRHPLRNYLIPISLVMLVAWAVATFYYSAPGWFHGFLTLGIFLLLWGIIDRPTRGERPPQPK